MPVSLHKKKPSLDLHPPLLRPQQHDRPVEHSSKIQYGNLLSPEQSQSLQELCDVEQYEFKSSQVQDLHIVVQEPLQQQMARQQNGNEKIPDCWEAQPRHPIVLGWRQPRLKKQHAVLHHSFSRPGVSMVISSPMTPAAIWALSPPPVLTGAPSPRMPPLLLGHQTSDVLCAFSLPHLHAEQQAPKLKTGSMVQYLHISGMQQQPYKLYQCGVWHNRQHPSPTTPP